MRGDDPSHGAAFSYVTPEQRVPSDHPLRLIREMTNEVPPLLSPRFEELYWPVGRPSNPPERLLRALLVTALRADHVTPHVEQNDTTKRSVIDRRTTRHPGYGMSRARRYIVERIPDWLKNLALLRKTKYRGRDRVDWGLRLRVTRLQLGENARAGHRMMRTRPPRSRGNGRESTLRPS